MMKIIFYILFIPFFALANVVGSDKDLWDLTSKENYRKSKEEIKSSNIQHLKEFVAFEVETSKDDIAKESPDYLSPRVASEVYSMVKRHPVVSMWEYEKYDPNDEGIGFCFGRAMFVHLELVQRGLDRDSIKKIFAMGPMNTSGGSNVEWGWHVATAVQSLDRYGEEKWLVIDPIFHKPLNIYDWYDSLYRQFSTDKKLRVWMTEAGKFAPSAGSYDHNSIENDFYNDYFIDLMNWFDEESKKGRYDEQLTEYQH